MDISRCTSLVTGANRGIGLAVATMPDLGGRVESLTLDLASRESIEQAASAARGVDPLINNAGVLQAGQLRPLAPEVRAIAIVEVVERPCCRQA